MVPLAMLPRCQHLLSHPIAIVSIQSPLSAFLSHRIMPTQVDTRDHSAIPILVEVQWFFRPEDTGLPAKVRQTVAHNEVRDSG